MPIYEYICERCNETFEVKIDYNKNAEEIICPKCGTLLVHKIFYSHPIIYKGKDWTKKIERKEKI